MVLAAKIQVYATPILCVIWLAGMVLALMKWRISPRTSILMIVGLFFAALGQTLDSINLLMSSGNNLMQSMTLFQGSFRLFKSILNYAPSIFNVLSWVLVFSAFFTVFGKEKIK